MEYTRKSSRNMNRSLLICCICQGKARGYNFNAITCMSCKIFFRRHALQAPGTYSCARSKHCEINIETRKNCIACRLRKCFHMGMDPSMIRLSKPDKNPYEKLPTPQTLSLLRNDHSSLTFDQWRLLSNIIHIYDSENTVKRLRQSLAQESSLPVKLRIKPTQVINCIQQCMSTVEMFLKQIPYFQNSSSDTKQLLVRNNFYAACFFNGILTGREVDLWSHQDFGISYDLLLGVKFFATIESISKRLDPNTTLAKLMLFIILFSANCSVVLYEKWMNMKNIEGSIKLVRIQDVLVEVMWKYLTYQYDFVEAVHRFSSLVKSPLDILAGLGYLVRCDLYHPEPNEIIYQMTCLLISNE